MGERGKMKQFITDNYWWVHLLSVMLISFIIFGFLALFAAHTIVLAFFLLLGAVIATAGKVVAEIILKYLSKR